MMKVSDRYVQTLLKPTN